VPPIIPFCWFPKELRNLLLYANADAVINVTATTASAATVIIFQAFIQFTSKKAYGGEG
jgi:hypothetical protein